MAKLPQIDGVAAMKTMTIQVKVRRVRELRLRLWIASQLMRLAAFVGNFNIELEDDPAVMA